MFTPFGTNSISGWPAAVLQSDAGPEARSRRVLLLVAIIFGLSLVDLHLTLLYLTHTGMPEANPLARLVISYDSPAILAVWKLSTVFLAAWILIRARATRTAEIGAWIGCIVLVWLSIHWLRYSMAADTVQQAELAMGAHANFAGWSSMTGPGGVPRIAVP